jgi:hypothetical protein
MTASRQQRPFNYYEKAMSAFHPTPDIVDKISHVRDVPKGDIRSSDTFAV